MALRPIGKIRLAALDREIQARAGTILPTFCPTAPHRAARTRITLNDQSAYPPADQGERASGEPCRTDTDESHPTEYRKVGGSIPSLPTRFAWSAAWLLALPLLDEPQIPAFLGQGAS
jgi:hypothetical protein